jgi:hypothetical protein
MKHLVNVAFVTALGLSASAWAQGQPTPPATTTPSIKLPEPSQANKLPKPTLPNGATSEPTTPKTATAAPSTPRPKRHVRRARRYARQYPYYEEDYYREDYYRGGGSPDDYMADELNRRQIPGGWYGGGVPYPYPPYTPAPYAPYPAPRTYYPWGY